LNKDLIRTALPKFSSSKRKIVNILFFTAVILILLNLVLDKIFLGSVKEEKELSGIELDNKFRTAVFNFGLETNWMKKIRLNRNDSIFASYKIDLPADLPVILILREINESFKKDYVHVESEEERINGRTKLKISSGNRIKLAAEFRYNFNLKRNAGEISFLLLDILNLNEKEDSVLLSSPELFKIVLIPSKASAEEARKISRYGKEYALLLNDEIPELKYSFKESYSPLRLKASVREILTDFPDLKFFIIDDNSGLYSSAVFPFIEKEFEKRKLNLLKKSSLELIEGSAAENIILRFKKITDTKEKKTILTTVQNYFLLDPEIIKYKKIGCKFVSPSLF
jgi:hypothetical protein